MARGKHTSPRTKSPSKSLAFRIGCIALAVVVCIVIAGSVIHIIQGNANSGSGLLVNNISKKYSEKTGGGNISEAESASSSAAPMSDEMRQVEASVQQLVAPYGDDVALVIQPLDGTQGLSINGDERFVSASMIKLLILAEFMDEVDKGVLQLDTVYTRDEKDVVGGTGVIQSDAPGTTYTYDDLARLMIAQSDNTATNVLIDKMGMDKINERARALKLQQTDLQRKMMQLDSGVENHIGANDATTILLGIKNHTLASDTMCQKAEGYLQAQTDSEGLAQGIPRNVAFGHKTGTLSSVRHDAGIVYAEKLYIITVLTNLDSSGANSLMEQISKTTYDILK